MTATIDNTIETTCVLREVAPRDFQYVPLAEVPNATLVPGERTFTGLFRTQVENLGPHGSHTRTICLPVGKLSESVLKQ